MLSAGRDAMRCSAVMQGEVGGRGLVGMNFDDDKAGENWRFVALLSRRPWQMGDGGMGKGGCAGWTGLDWIDLSLCSFFPVQPETRQTGPT